jgi:hypothetical protein
MTIQLYNQFSKLLGKERSIIMSLWVTCVQNQQSQTIFNQHLNEQSVALISILKYHTKCIELL